MNVTTNWVQSDTIDDVIKILDSIPKEYLCIQDDCNNEDGGYLSKDVMQIRPSTHPLFFLKKLGLAVKVIYDKERVENEKRARQALKSSFTLVPMEYACYGNIYLEIMPYIYDSIMLSELSKIDISEFIHIYNKTSSIIFQYIMRNKKTASKNEKVIYAGRSLECMQQWTTQMINLLDGYRLFSHTTGSDYSLSEVMKNALCEITNSTQHTCFFSGDINCHNILLAKKEVILIDFEYWGKFDVDYLISIMVGSLFSHCDLIENYQIKESDKCIEVKYGLKIDLSDIGALKILQDICVNSKRIKSFILARMYYKFIEIIKNPKNCKHIIVVCALLDFFAKYSAKDNKQSLCLA